MLLSLSEEISRNSDDSIHWLLLFLLMNKLGKLHVTNIKGPTSSFTKTNSATCVSQKGLRSSVNVYEVLGDSCLK